MGRRSGWRFIKTNYTYTVEEAARNQGKSKGTVRRWIKNGLPVLSDRRPILILGGDLVDFLKGQKKPKQTCQLEECYCFKCKAPRKAGLGEAEYMAATPSTGRLTALCVECTTVMNKRVSLAALGALRGILRITIKQAPDHIVERE